MGEYMRQKRSRLVSVLGLAFCLLAITGIIAGCGGQGTETGEIAAIVGDREIELREITDYLTSLRVDYPTAEAALEARQGQLDRLVKENLFTIGAYSSAMDADIGIIELVDREKDKFLLDELFRREVIEKATVSEADIEEAYSHWFERLRPMHILVESRAQADSILTAINGGGDFGDLAEKHSLDKGTAVRGGDFGRDFRWGELIPSLQELLFSLDEGAVGGPIETDFGWHVVKVKTRNEVERIPLEELRTPIESRLRRQAQERRRLEQVDELRELANTQLNTDALTVLGNVSRGIADTAFAPLFAQPPLPLDAFSEEELGMMLAAYAPDGQVTIGTFREGMMSRPPQSRPDVRNADQVKEFVFQLTLFDILRNEAIRLEMDQTPIYRERLREFQENLMAEKMRTAVISKNLVVPEDDVRAYYDAHIDSFVVPVSLHIIEVLLHSKDDAMKVLKAARAGTPLEELARLHTQRAGLADKGGDLGWILPDRYPDLYEAARTLKPGEITGPASGVNQHSIIKLIETAPGRQKPYDEVQVVIFDRLKKNRTDSIVEAYTDSMKALYTVSIKEDVLGSNLEVNKRDGTGE